MNNIEYDKFLGKLYDILLNGKIISYDKDAKDLKEKKLMAEKYLEKLQRIQDKSLENDRYLDMIKKLYYDRYVIKEEDVPESYLSFLEQQYLEQGRGYLNLVNPQNDFDIQMRKERIDMIIMEQKDSLDNWLNYFLSEDSSYLPMWAKVWAFQGMLKIGNLNKNKDGYCNRSKTTVNPFVSMDLEILGKCVQLIKDSFNKKNLSDNELNKLLSNGSFSKIYGKMLSDKKKIKIESNDGVWIKYNCENEKDIREKEEHKITPEYIKLYDSLQGYNTGWCTAGSKETTKSQMLAGDFYVFYSKDSNGEYKIPRLAIRMNKGSIAEIRGIADKQNIESNMEDVIEEKLKEFPDSKIYQTKVNDMRKLTDIYNKHKEGAELTKNQLRFLYQIEYRIMTFGTEWHGIPAADPRVDEILSTRNKREDFAKMFDCNIDEIGFTKNELRSNLVFYEGDIELQVSKIVKNIIKEFNIPIMIDDLILPKIVRGDINLGEIVSAKKIVLPQTVMGKVNLSKLHSVKELVLPSDEIYNSLCLGLKKINNLMFPKKVGSLSMEIKYANSIVFPQYVYDSVYLSSLIVAENVVMPEYIGGTLNLGNLKSLKGIILPKNVRGKHFTSGFCSSQSIFYKNQYRTLDEMIELQKLEQKNEIITKDTKKKTKRMGFVNVTLIIFSIVAICVLSIIFSMFILK